MPKNEKERIIYILVVCLCMTWLLGILSGMINAGGFSTAAIINATKQEPIVYLFATVIAYLGIQKASVKSALFFLNKTDSDNAKILAVSFFMVTYMSPCVLMFRLILNNGFMPNLISVWFMTWLRGFTMALFLNLLVAGPIGRAVLRIYRDKR